MHLLRKNNTFRLRWRNCRTPLRHNQGSPPDARRPPPNLPRHHPLPRDPRRPKRHQRPLPRRHQPTRRRRRHQRRRIRSVRQRATPLTRPRLPTLALLRRRRSRIRPELALQPHGARQNPNTAPGRRQPTTLLERHTRARRNARRVQGTSRNNPTRNTRILELFPRLRTADETR